MQKSFPHVKYALLEPFRGLAALWVFSFHYHFSETFRQAYPSLHSLCKRGYLGVPMFFVISGFCITASARSAIRNEESWLSFLYRRARRIYPPYWCSILVIVALPFVMAGIDAVKTGNFMAPQATRPGNGFLNYGALDWLNVVSLGKIFAPMPGITSLQSKFAAINAVYWTLAIEVQFYACVALALIFRRYFYPVLLLVTLASAPFLFTLQSVSRTGFFLPFWPMFSVGILLFVCMERGFSPSRLAAGRAALISGLCAAGFALAFALVVLKAVPVSFAAFAAGFGIFLLAAEGLDLPFMRQLSSSPFFPFRVFLRLLAALGAMSYSLYLIHGKVNALVTYFLRRIPGANGILIDAGAISLTCAICYLFYLACEKPFISSKRSPWLNSPVKWPDFPLLKKREKPVASTV